MSIFRIKTEDNKGNPLGGVAITYVKWGNATTTLTSDENGDLLMDDGLMQLGDSYTLMGSKGELVAPSVVVTATSDIQDVTIIVNTDYGILNMFTSLVIIRESDGTLIDIVEGCEGYETYLIWREQHPIVLGRVLE